MSNLFKLSYKFDLGVFSFMSSSSYEPNLKTRVFEQDKLIDLEQKIIKEDE